VTHIRDSSVREVELPQCAIVRGSRGQQVHQRCRTLTATGGTTKRSRTRLTNYGARGFATATAMGDNGDGDGAARGRGTTTGTAATLRRFADSHNLALLARKYRRHPMWYLLASGEGTLLKNVMRNVSERLKVRFSQIAQQRASPKKYRRRQTHICASQRTAAQAPIPGQRARHRILPIPPEAACAAIWSETDSSRS
jgi:hypothetical protein